MNKKKYIEFLKELKKLFKKYDANIEYDYMWDSHTNERWGEEIDVRCGNCYSSSFGTDNEINVETLKDKIKELELSK